MIENSKTNVELNNIIKEIKQVRKELISSLGDISLLLDYESLIKRACRIISEESFLDGIKASKKIR